MTQTISFDCSPSSDTLSGSMSVVVQSEPSSLAFLIKQRIMAIQGPHIGAVFNGVEAIRETTVNYRNTDELLSASLMNCLPR